SRSINCQFVYHIASGQLNFTGFFPAARTSSSQQGLYQNLASSVLGLVGLSQVIYTRTGSSLQIQPIGTQALEASTIKYYSSYFADTWRMKPSLTFTFGVSYMYETPPVEKNGAQVELVDTAGNLVHTNQFLAERKAAALAEQAYAPILWFATPRTLKIKHHYTPAKGGISPRVAVAWNPNYKSGFLGKVLGEGK